MGRFQFLASFSYEMEKKMAPVDGSFRHLLHNVCNFTACEQGIGNEQADCIKFASEYEVRRSQCRTHGRKLVEMDLFGLDACRFNIIFHLRIRSHVRSARVCMHGSGRTAHAAHLPADFE